MALASTSLKTRVFSSEICPGTDSFSDCTGEFSLSLVRLGVVPPKSGVSGRISEEALFTPAAFFEPSSLPKAFLSSSIFAALFFLPSVFSLRLPPDKISSKMAGSMEKLSSDFLSGSFFDVCETGVLPFFSSADSYFSLRVPSALSAREPSPFEPFRTRTAPHQLKGHQSPQATRACSALFLYLFRFR